MDGSRLEALIARIRDGSDEAAWELVEEYGPHVHAVVSRRLNPSMRRAFDTNDFLQAAWASLFRVLPRLELVNDPKKFVALLATIACRRMNNEYRRRQLVDPDKVQDTRANTEAPSLTDLQAGKDPTPSQIVVARERWRNLVKSLPQQHVDVINYRMHGMTQKEIAERTGLSTRTVRRIIDRALKQSATSQS